MKEGPQFNHHKAGDLLRARGVPTTRAELTTQPIVRCYCACGAVGILTDQESLTLAAAREPVPFRCPACGDAWKAEVSPVLNSGRPSLRVASSDGVEQPKPRGPRPQK